MCARKITNTIEPRKKNTLHEEKEEEAASDGRVREKFAPFDALFHHRKTPQSAGFHATSGVRGGPHAMRLLRNRRNHFYGGFLPIYSGPQREMLKSLDALRFFPSFLCCVRDGDAATTQIF